MTLLVVALFGGLGAMLRWLLDLAAAARLGRALPWGTILANVLGSMAAGALAGATLAGHLGPTWTRVLAVGLCGGFTTFSAASIDAARAAGRDGVARGLALLLVPMVLAVAAGIAGYAVAGA